MKSLFRILACLLFSCVFFSNAYAEEKVSREQVDTLVARVLRTTLIQPEIQFIIHNNKYERDPSPISPSCNCPACRHYSKGYIRHLFKSKEMLGMRLAVMHNLYFYNDLMAKIRLAIEEGRYGEFYEKYRISLQKRV